MHYKCVHKVLWCIIETGFIEKCYRIRESHCSAEMFTYFDLCPCVCVCVCVCVQMQGAGTKSWNRLSALFNKDDEHQLLEETESPPVPDQWVEIFSSWSDVSLTLCAICGVCVGETGLFQGTVVNFDSFCEFRQFYEMLAVSKFECCWTAQQERSKTFVNEVEH